MPRQQHSNLVSDPYRSHGPAWKQPVRRPKDQLNTITERSDYSPKATSVFGGTPEFGLHAKEKVVIDEHMVQTKDQKGPINLLATDMANMLSALSSRRGGEERDRRTH